MNDEKLVLVMPAYNEQDNIEQVIRDWYGVSADKGENFEFVVNVSGSKDKTADIIRKMMPEYPALRLLEDSQNSYGDKIIDLYRYACDNGADWIFQTDSDGQTNPAEFEGFWQEREKYDAIIGNRAVRGDGQARYYVEKIVVKLLKHYFHEDIPDANAPFRLIRGSIMDSYLEIIDSSYSMPNILFTVMLCVGRQRVLFREISFVNRSKGSNKMNYRKICNCGIESLKVFKKYSARFVPVSKFRLNMEKARFIGPVQTCIHLINSHMLANRSRKLKEKPVSQIREEKYKKGEISHCLIYTSLNGNSLYYDMEEPKTFGEKLQWLMFFDAVPAKTQLADKYLAKKLIGQIVGEKYPVPLLGVWDRPEDIDWDALPHSFMFKANHSCRTNVHIGNKDEVDRTKVCEELNAYLKDDFTFRIAFELQYHNIPRRVFAEELLPWFMQGSREYKFMCMDGKIAFIYDFYCDENTYTTTLYDENWNMLDWTDSRDWPTADKPSDKPEALEEMCDLARKLSKGFALVRVDLYVVGDRVLVGELTFTPQAGVCSFSTLGAELAVGKMIRLPEKYPNPIAGEGH